MNKNEKNVSTAIAEGEVATDTGIQKKPVKKKGRFNAVDFLLILIALAVVAAAVIYLVPGLVGRLSSNTTEVTYTVEFRGVDPDFITNIQAGDKIYDANQNFMIGTVRSVATDSYSVLAYDPVTGEGVMKEHPTLKTLIITVNASAVYTEGEGYYVNGERIAVGRKYDLRLPHFTGSAYCVEVETSSK